MKLSIENIAACIIDIDGVVAEEGGEALEKPDVYRGWGGVPMDGDKKRTKKSTIEDRLREQRKELIIKRLGIEESWQNLHLNEIELTEKATNEYLAAGLSQMDAQDKKKIEAIDRALARLRADIYDLCESCGEVISEKRLEAVPWTTLCRDCAEEREQGARLKRPAAEIEEEAE